MACFLFIPPFFECIDDGIFLLRKSVVREHSLVLQLIKGILDDPVLIVEPKVLVPLVESVLNGQKNNLGRALVIRGVEKQLGRTFNKVRDAMFQ